MTPLEIMAKAAINKSLEQAGRTIMVSDLWPGPADIVKAEDVMRAALLALADAACPRELLLPHGLTPRHWAMMRTIIRAITEDGQPETEVNAMAE